MNKVKMVFGEDKFYTDQKKPLYLAGEEYEIELNMVDRWLKRGGVIVEESLEPKQPVKKKGKKEEDSL